MASSLEVRTLRLGDDCAELDCRHCVNGATAAAACRLLLPAGCCWLLAPACLAAVVAAVGAVVVVT